MREPGPAAEFGRGRKDAAYGSDERLRYRITF
jgi:hypothetical protein